MGKFSFTSTTECDVCGAQLSASDEECDHGGQKIDTFLFRRIGEGRDSLVGVQCVNAKKWHELCEKIGDDWIAYEYIGTKERVNRWIRNGYYDSIEDLPRFTMSTDAPSDVGESE